MTRLQEMWVRLYGLKICLDATVSRTFIATLKAPYSLSALTFYWPTPVDRVILKAGVHEWPEPAECRKDHTLNMYKVTWTYKKTPDPKAEGPDAYSVVF